MKIGDRVIYLINFPVNLDNDMGTVVGWDEDVPFDPIVEFDDGYTGSINRGELALVVGKASEKSV